MTDPLDVLRRQAKTLHKQYETGHSAAISRLRAINPRPSGPLKHADFLHVIARENSFNSWPQMKTAVETQGMDRAAKLQRLKIALAHGQVPVVQQLMWDTPDLADGAFGLQVALYDLVAVRRVLADDPGAATRVAGPRRPILHLAFSKMLQVWPKKEADMLAIAELLVAHGADVNDAIPPEPGNDHRLSALYGAIGHAGNMPLARWLLEHGANPNDGESLYHATELGHRDGLKLLLDHGVDPKGTNALLRAMDFDDLEAVQMLLAAGADPNEDRQISALHQAARRMSSVSVCRALLDAGADPTRDWHGASAYAFARVYGNAALAEMIVARGPSPDLSPMEQLLAAAAQGHAPEGQFIDPARVPALYADIMREIVHLPGKLPHLRALVALGMSTDRPDGAGLTPVQVAGWEGLPEVLSFLLRQKPDLSHVNGYGGTLLSTIIHGSENNPQRAGRDYLACLEMVLTEGVALPKKAIALAGDPDVAAYLADWADRYPGQVVVHGFA